MAFLASERGLAGPVHPGSIHRQRALDAGYQEHLGKPIQAAELARVVAKLTGRIPRT
ncbi:MAG TPA: hypothetical protein VGW35_20350 [Methylomirabilota bacterium]|jgi:CheY-like chemotaxis protein|nr:hypothetical protein [Methylomirabilota bacterium]